MDEVQFGRHSSLRGQSWKIRDDASHGGLKARLMPHAWKRHGITKGVEARCNSRSLHKARDATEECHDRARAIFRDSIREVVLRLQTLRFAFRSRQVVH